MLFLAFVRRLRTACVLTLFAFGAANAGAAQTILVFGDSLSAGYGIRQDAAWPALLGKRLQAERLDYSVVNVSISGETTAGGRSRLPKALKTHRPALVVLALGANDGLRGLPTSVMRENIEAMIDASTRSGAKVLLVGMRLPPNYGPYALDFERTFAEIARGRKLSIVPFLLEPIVGQVAMFQPDMLHPTAEAQPKLLETIWPRLKPLL